MQWVGGWSLQPKLLKGKTLVVVAIFPRHERFKHFSGSASIISVYVNSEKVIYFIFMFLFLLLFLMQTVVIIGLTVSAQVVSERYCCLTLFLLALFSFHARLIINANEFKCLNVSVCTFLN